MGRKESSPHMRRRGKGRTRPLLAVVGVLLLLVGAGCDRIISTPAPPPTFIPPAGPPSGLGGLSGGTNYTVKRGAITEELHARGLVVAVREAYLSFPMAGWIKTLEILPGDVVQGQDLLAELDVPELLYEIEDRDYDLELSKLYLVRAQVELTRTLNYRQQELTEAEQELIKAQAAHDRAEATLQGARASRKASQAGLQVARADIDAAEASVAAAMAGLSLLRAGPTEQGWEIAKMEIDRARNSLWAAQAGRDSIGGSVQRGEVSAAHLDAAEAEVGRAHVALMIAELVYEEMEAGPRPEEFATAQAQVSSAEAALFGAEARLEEAQASFTHAYAEVTIAEADLQTAAARITTAEAEVTHHQQLLLQDRAIQELAVAIQEKRVRYSGRLLERSERRVDRTRLRAPFRGVIVSLDVQLGQYVTPYESFGVIADPSQVELEMTVPQLDVAKVAVGQTVQAKLDAYHEDLFRGRIVSIAAEPIVWQGKNAHEVRVQFDDPESVPATIRMGADVTLAVQRKEDVLLIPTAAIFGLGDRQYVDLVGGEQIQRVPILVGITNEEWAELLSGVEEGQTIRLP